MQLALEAHSNPGTDLEPTAWIAARYEAASLPDEMLLGDASWPGSGDHFNRPLPDLLPYRVFLRAVTVTSVRPTTRTLSVLSHYTATFSVGPFVSVAHHRRRLFFFLSTAKDKLPPSPLLLSPPFFSFSPPLPLETGPLNTARGSGGAL